MIHYVKDFALQRGGEDMFEKNLTLSELLDEYAPVLSERHRMLLDCYYNQDLSLAEIAAEVGISRQGVRDGIKKAEEELFFLEKGLGLLARSRAVQKKAKQLLSNASAETAAALQALLDELGIDTNEESEGVLDGNV